MPQLLAGKTALVLGVANKWSIAYAISSAFVREGASLVLTYQGERQRHTVEELGAELKASKVLNCDVTKPDELEHLVSELKQSSPVVDTLVHSIAFANKDDLSRPFLESKCVFISIVMPGDCPANDKGWIGYNTDLPRLNSRRAKLQCYGSCEGRA
jgi:enoyl-[acyl-carrier-protein] reductase (NADH)